MSSHAFSNDDECASRLDRVDPLAGLRDHFAIPKSADGSDSVYLVGHSLGAMPSATPGYVAAELDRWAQIGVAGHHQAPNPWVDYHDLVVEQMARVVGGSTDEVVVMNALTVNLHLMMTSFYRPTSQRHVVLIEEHAFPSDHFAVESQIRQRGLDPETSLVVVSPRPGEQLLRSTDILDSIAEIGEQLAVVLLPGIQYYTGQVLDMASIVEAGHRVGATVGFDLAHAAGNIELELHDWDVDFAVWCTYKYLNSGPGGVGGAFVHRRHVADQELHKYLGWWGNRRDTRFEMSTVYEPVSTAESWQVSNSAVVLLASLRASLDLVDRAGGMPAIRKKSELQIGYLDYLLDTEMQGRIESITPRPLSERGSQFALEVVDRSVDGREVFDGLTDGGVSCDWRFPNVIRVAPTPLYNSFSDIRRFVSILDQLIPSRPADT